MQIIFKQIYLNTEKSPGDLRICCHSNSREKPSTNASIKTRKGINNNNNNR